MIFINDSGETVELNPEQAAVTDLIRYTKKTSNLSAPTDIFVIREPFRDIADDDVPPCIRLINATGQRIELKPGESKEIGTKFLERMNTNGNLHSIELSKVTDES